LRFLRIRKVRPNDANGMCRRETIPANPAFPEGDCSNKWTLALCVPIKRTTHMYGRFIAMVKGLFSLGMLDPTPLIGDASVLRRLVVQILRSELRARCVGTGTRLYEQIRTMCSQGVCTVRLVIRAPPANSQKHQVLFVTRHNPSDPPQWVFNGSLFSCFISILTLTHSLICMLHRKRGSFCREISHHKVKGKLLPCCFFFGCLSTSTDHLHSIFFSKQVKWTDLQSRNRFGGTWYDHDGPVP